MGNQSGREGWLRPLMVWGATFAFYRSLANGGVLYVGHDHWCSGHLMLLAESYVNNGFSTPLMLPTEDPFGPIDTWAPYSGWPPLFALSLAVFLKAFGTGLGIARTFACLWSGASAALTYVILRRTIRNPFFVSLGMLLFLSHSVVVRYSAFVCNDVAALTCCLAFTLAYPASVEARPVWPIVLVCVLASLSGLLSWQCYVAPLGSAVALCVVRPGLVRGRWVRAFVPVVVVAITGVVLLLAFALVDRQNEPNGWQEYTNPVVWKGNMLMTRLLIRTGYGEPARAIRVAAYHLMSMTRQFYVPVVLALVSWGLFHRRGSMPAEMSPDHDGRGEYLVLALWLLPFGWLALMPNMHAHDFQLIFSAPALCVCLSAILKASWPRFESLRGGRIYAMMVAAIIGAIAVIQVANQSRTFRGAEDFDRLARAIRSASTAETVVVFGADKNEMSVIVDDRGLWWQIRRPAISLKRIARVRDRDHLLVISSRQANDWNFKYELVSRIEYNDPFAPILILRPRPQSPSIR
jgi:hypothetical protein